MHWALARFSRVELVNFSYGQRHSIEAECAQKIAEKQGLVIHQIDLGSIMAQVSQSALLEQKTSLGQVGQGGLPNSFVPGRNIIFLSLAAPLGLMRGLTQLVVGFCETDYSGYPDCREAFVAGQEDALAHGLDSRIRIHRPLMTLSKAQTFQMAEDLGVLESIIEDTHTCYEGDRSQRHPWGYGCARCPACQLRARGFEQFLSSKSSLPTSR